MNKYIKIVSIGCIVVGTLLIGYSAHLKGAGIEAGILIVVMAVIPKLSGLGGD